MGKCHRRRLAFMAARYFKKKKKKNFFSRVLLGAIRFRSVLELGVAAWRLTNC